jgi:hypothetical protein
MKRKLQTLIIVFTIALLASCSENKSNNGQAPGTKLVSNDLENNSWMNQNTLVKDVAHSGRYSSKLDSLNQFSFGFSNNFASISDTLPISVDVSCWLYFPQNGIKTSLVLSVDSANKSIYWKAIILTDSVKTANQWKEIKATLEIPKKIMPTDNLKIYVWSSDKRTFYMDDFSLLFHVQ